ncbi:MAG: HD domain-containing protein [Turicibacter sp.]|nr:HD domain-containing protein [Turicibacter sp.]
MIDITYSDAGTLYIVKDNELVFHIFKNKTLNLFKSAENEEIDLPPIQLNENSINNVSAYCAVKNEAVIVEDVYSDERFLFAGTKEYDKRTGYNTRSMLVIPLSGTDGEVLGVIQLLNATNPTNNEPITYSEVYTPFIAGLSTIAANTLTNLMHRKEMHGVFLSFAAAMTQAVDERSHTTKFHTQNVSKYCRAFAKYLSDRFGAGHKLYFDDDHIERIGIAALLHDIGKLAIPTDILDKHNKLSDVQMGNISNRFEIKKCRLQIERLTNLISTAEYTKMTSAIEYAFETIKRISESDIITDEEFAKIQEVAAIELEVSGNKTPLITEAELEAINIRRGNLTPKEWAIMRNHINITSRILDQVTFLKNYVVIPKWAKNHHEFLNGTGYPQGLKGDEIDIETCIITIIDIFEALTSLDRPYRKGTSTDNAIEILRGFAREGKINGEILELFAESQIWKGVVT